MTREHIEVFRKILEINYKNLGESEAKEFVKDFNEILNLAIKAIEQEPRWIPVSERLPEEREWIGSKRFGTTISDEVYVTFETPDGERFTKHLSFQNGGLCEVDQETMRIWFKGAVPIAWMPLPKPYEPKESEKNNGL